MLRIRNNLILKKGQKLRLKIIFLQFKKKQMQIKLKLITIL
jgi:hypothetical protein